MLPVWGWGAVVLVAAYVWAQYRAKTAAAQGNGSTSTTNAAGESTAAAPQFIIENNEPWNSGNSYSAPVVTSSPPVPVTTSSGTTTTPPTSIPVQGGKPPVAAGPAGPATPAAATTSGTPKGTTYTVQAGDSLWSIAQKELGNGADYMQIWTYNQVAANRGNLPKVVGSSPSLIYPGEIFVIPPKK